MHVKYCGVDAFSNCVLVLAFSNHDAELYFRAVFLPPLLPCLLVYPKVLTHNVSQLCWWINKVQLLVTPS